MSAEVARLIAVMGQLRQECPWNAQQNHRSLVQYLIEEACECVEAIEDGTVADLREELGDLLLNVVFHCEIAAEQGQFTIDDVAAQIADKLISRHPYVFSDGDLPTDLHGAWERHKRAEKARTSALDGIPHRMSAIARATKVIGRTRSHGLDLGMPTEPIEATDVGNHILWLVARAQASGIDAEQAVRDRLRELEVRVIDVEGAPSN